MEGTTGRGTYLSSGHLGTYEGKVLEGVEDGGGLRKSCGEEGDSVDVGKRNSAPESGLKIDLNLRQSFPTVGTRSKAAFKRLEGWSGASIIFLHFPSIFLGSAHSQRYDSGVRDMTHCLCFIFPGFNVTRGEFSKSTFRKFPRYLPNFVPSIRSFASFHELHLFTPLLMKLDAS
jgi:hypothetical protein